MSLKVFHIVFIIVSTLLCVFMAAWGWNEYTVSASKMGITVGSVGIAGLILLVPYYNWFRKKAQSLKAAAFLLLVSGLTSVLHSQTAQACSACFGDPASPMTKGLKVGILFLLFVIGSLLAGIASVGVTWARRAKALGR